MESLDRDEEARILDQIEAKSKPYAPRAKTIRSVMKTVLIKRGINDEQAAFEFDSAWRRIAHPLHIAETKIGRMYRGILTIWVTNNLVLQELDFSRAKYLAALKAELPHVKLRDIRFRIEG